MARWPHAHLPCQSTTYRHYALSTSFASPNTLHNLQMLTRCSAHPMQQQPRVTGQAHAHITRQTWSHNKVALKTSLPLVVTCYKKAQQPQPTGGSSIGQPSPLTYKLPTRALNTRPILGSSSRWWLASHMHTSSASTFESARSSAHVCPMFMIASAAPACLTVSISCHNDSAGYT